MSEELVRWLGEQFDEDERTARATVWDGSGNQLDWELIASATIDVGGDEFYVGDRTIANHMMAWEPARVLREIDAKRRLLDLHEPTMNPGRDSDDDDPSTWLPVCSTCQVEIARPGDWPCEHLRLLALPYADRPGYREEWRP